MKTTLDLPQNLLEEAQQLLATTSKRETIIEALKKVILLYKRQAIIDNKGKLNIQLDLEVIRERGENIS